MAESSWCIENDFAAQKELAEREGSGIHKLREELAASQKREGILREVVVEVKETSESVFQSTYRTRFNKYFLRFIRITTDALKRTEEVKP